MDKEEEEEFGIDFEMYWPKSFSLSDKTTSKQDMKLRNRILMFYFLGNFWVSEKRRRIDEVDLYVHTKTKKKLPGDMNVPACSNRDVVWKKKRV